MTQLFLVSGLVLVLGVASLAARPAGPPGEESRSGAVVADSSVAGTMALLDSLIRVPAPRGLTAAQGQEWSRHTTWLRSVKSRLQTQVRTSDPGKGGNLLRTLQAQLLAEGQRMSLSFPSLRARHDAAMNAIRNMKA